MDDFTKYNIKKTNSITEAAIRRDSAMFTSARLSTWKEVKQENMIEELEFWTKFFEKRYVSKEVEMSKKAEKMEKAKAEAVDGLVEVDEVINS